MSISQHTIRSTEYLGQQFLLVCLHPETVAGTSRDAGRVADLPHPADLSHHPTLLLQLLALPPLPVPRLRKWTRNLQFILFIWIKMTQRVRKEVVIRDDLFRLSQDILDKAHYFTLTEC